LRLVRLIALQLRAELTVIHAEGLCFRLQFQQPVVSAAPKAVVQTVHG
jgi:hypothetical protein